MSGFPRQKTVVLDQRARPQRGYRLHELEPCGFLDAPYGTVAEAQAIRKRLVPSAHRYSRSVAGRGRQFSIRKLEETMRIIRTA